MHPDYLFIIFGVLASVAAITYAVVALTKRAARSLFAAACWAALACGLFLQGFAPNLQIDSEMGRSAFVIPPSEAMTPAAPLVHKERQFKLLSALLMVCGAVGFGVYYWPMLKQKP